MNCGPLQVFLVLKISVQPAQWFEFDMPDIDPMILLLVRIKSKGKSKIRIKLSQNNNFLNLTNMDGI